MKYFLKSFVFLQRLSSVPQWWQYLWTVLQPYADTYRSHGTKALDVIRLISPVLTAAFVLIALPCLPQLPTLKVANPELSEAFRVWRCRHSPQATILKEGPLKCCMYWCLMAWLASLKICSLWATIVHTGICSLSAKASSVSFGFFD